MSLPPPPSIESVYLVGLKAPQQAAAAVDRVRRAAENRSFVSDPLPAVVPLLESRRSVSPPVPGLLPPCRCAVRLATDPVIDETGRCVFLPVDAGGWLEELSSALARTAGNERSSGEKRPGVLYPHFRGVPAAFLPSEGADERETALPAEGLPSPGWRALALECYRIEWIAGRPWYLSVAWSRLWSRRLRRAPL